MLGFNKKLPLTYLIKIEKFKKLQTNNIVKKKLDFKYSFSSYINAFVNSERELIELKRNNIKNLIKINACRGIQHMLDLPVRGQRKRSNGKTRKLHGLKKNEFSRKGNIKKGRKLRKK